MPIFKKKEESPQEKLRNLVEKLEDVKFNISMHKRRLEAKLKRYLKKGKIPPAALLVGWKTSDMLLSTIESSVISLQTALMVNEIGDAVKDAVGSKSLAQAGEILKQLSESLTDVRLTLHQMVNVQSQMVNIAQGMNQNLENMMQEIMGTAEEVMPEVVETIGSEFLEEIKNSDPELFSNLPEELKKKLLETEEG
ncbi:MAG: hypothetical protein ACP6IP_02375 [Candidatus Njordarchaeia archaeon]